MITIVPHTCNKVSDIRFVLNGTRSENDVMCTSTSGGGAGEYLPIGALDSEYTMTFKFWACCGMWITSDIAAVSAGDLHGAVPTKNGGTGLESPEAGKYLRTNGAEPMELVTPEQLAADVAPHLPHQAFEAAVAAGYAETEETFNTGLASIGNLNTLLDAINGEVV